MEEKKQTFEVTIGDIARVFAVDQRNYSVLYIIRISSDNPELGFELRVLENYLSALPEYKAYIDDHNELVNKYGREPTDEKEKRRGSKIVDAQCPEENIKAFQEAEETLLKKQVELTCKKLPRSLFAGQKINNAVIDNIFAFIDLDK